jgi:hypothetical protein
MDKETLSNYGWIVICTLVLAVMIALATPFGQFIADGVQSTAQGLVDTSNKALDLNNIDPAISDMYPAATGLTNTMLGQVDYANRNLNYLYAVKPGATTIEEAFIQKQGVEYIGEKTGVFWATGDKVKVVKDGYLLGEYVVVVLGDVGCGDGWVDGLDLMIEDLAINNWHDPTGAFLMAADTDGDGQITHNDFEMIADIAVQNDLAYEKAFIAATGIKNIKVSYDLGTAGAGVGNNKLHNADGSDFITTVALENTFNLPTNPGVNLGAGNTFSHWVNQKTGKTYSGNISAYDLLLENGLDNNVVMEAQWK